MSDNDNKNRRKRPFIRKFLIVFLTILIIFFSLVFTVLSLISLPKVQNYAKDKVVQMLEKKTGAEIQLQSFYAGLDGIISLKHFFLKDKAHDTLLQANQLKIQINTSGLFKKEIDILSIHLDSVLFNLKIYDTAGNTNLTPIIKSFAGDSTKKEVKTDKPGWKIQLHQVRLKQARFRMENLYDSTKMEHSLGLVNIDLRLGDIINQRFIARKVVVANYSGYIKNFKKALSHAVEKKDTAKSKLALVIAAPDIDLHRISFMHLDSASGTKGAYSINEAHVVPKTIDLKNQRMVIDSLSINHGTVLIQGPTATATKQKETNDKKNPKDTTVSKNWSVSLLHSDIFLDSVHFEKLAPQIKGFEYLRQMNFLNLKSSLQASFLSAEEWSASNCQLSVLDNRTGQKIHVSTNAKASKGFIFIDDFSFKTGSSVIEGNLKLKTSSPGYSGTPLPDFQFNISLASRDLMPYLPASFIPSIIKKPDLLYVDGTFNSENQLIKSITNVTSYFGNITIDAVYHNENISSESKYAANIHLDNIEMPKLINDTNLGVFSGSVYAEGIVPRNNSLAALVNITVDSIFYKKVMYYALTMDANVKNDTLMAHINSSNNIADFTIDLSGNYQKGKRNLNLKSEVRNIDLHAMRLTNDTIGFSSRLNLNYLDMDSATFEMFADTSDWILHTKSKEIKTQQQWSYFSSPDSVAAEFYSGNISLLYTGNIRLEEMATLMANYFSQYYASGEEKEKLIDKNKSFMFSMSLNELDQFSEIMPGNLKVPGQNMIFAQLKNNNLEASIDINKAFIKDFTFDSLNLKVQSDTSSLHLGLSVNMNNPKYHERGLKVNSSLSNGNLESRIIISNPDDLPWINIGFKSIMKFPILKAQIIEPFVIAHQEWTVDTNNILLVENKQVQKLDFLMENGPKMLHFYRPSIGTYASEFKELNLAFFSELIFGDTTTMQGDLYGNLSFTPSKTEKQFPLFDLEINIDQLKLQQYELGNTRIKTSNRRNNAIAEVNFRQRFNEADFLIKGTLGLKDDYPVNLNLISRNLELSNFSGLLQSFIDEPKGRINSNLFLSGTIKQPSVEGFLSFDSVQIGLNAINNTLNINGQSITFLKNNRVELRNFTITDSRKNSLSIDAALNYSNLKYISYQSKIITNRFLVYSSSDDVVAEKNSKVFLTSDIRINGVGTQPVVKANLQIDEGSRFYYELSNQFNNYSEAGVVVFADTQIVVPNAPTSVIKNLNLTANLIIADGTAIHIVTDPARGDGFMLQAGGALSISQQPFQDPRLTGRIDISKGQYIMNLTGFKRNFDIAPGSSINWNGDLMNIDFKLHAYYTVKASPVPILPNADASKFSGLLPFEVNLNLDGDLAEPEMAFNITLPDEYQDVYNGMVASRLQQINTDEAMVNKQAMSLLLFGTFFDLGDISNNLLSGRSSTNILITNALNQFAAQEIRFVNLHFDLQTYDYYGGGDNFQDARTELKVDASKKFWNGKMNTQGGADILLQGDPREEANLRSNRFTPSFKVDYFLNKKRTVSVKVFQQNEYRGLLEGKVISVGAGVQYTNDYDQIRDLINRKNKEENSYIQ